MEKLRAFGVTGGLLTGLAAAWVVITLVLAALPVSQVFAQEQFFTQSGGRGLQNAKTNARITKVETDVGDVKAQVAKIQPFAYAQLGTCSEDGEKLRWDGTNWICESETDPTVQPWAKKALPTCGAGTMLGVANGEFSCVNMGFVSTEVDPTVQAWAKSPLPNCGINEILAVGGDRMLMCSKDYQGVSTEKDPNIFDFAHKDIVGALPNCSTSENLTMMNGRLLCKASAGVVVEADPKVQAFARNDIADATLAACAVGEVLTAVDSGGNVVLQCASATGSLSEVLALNDLRDVSITTPVSNSVLAYDGSGWTNAKETDPIIRDIAACSPNSILTWDGTDVKCTVDVGSSGTLHLGELADVNTTGQDDGNLLQYSSTTHTWRPYALPICTTGKILTTNGVDFSCVNDAGGVGDPLDLTELGDVRISSMTALAPNDEDLLRWDSASSKWKPIHDRTSGAMTDAKWCHYQGTTSSGEIVCDRGAPQQCLVGQVLEWVSSSAVFNCVSATTSLGLGTMAAQNADDVSITGGVINGTVIGGTNPAAASFTTVNVTNLLATGLVRSTNLQVSSALVEGNARVTGNLLVEGNLSISGSQTIDGVTFANGGIQLSGSIVGGRLDVGNISATNVSATANVSADRFIANHFVGTDGVWNGVSATNISVTLNQTIGGDLWVGGNFYVSGSQSIDGVLFANGGIVLSGTVGAGNVSATNISGTYADIRNLSVTNGALVGTDVTVTRDVGVGRNLFVTNYAGITRLGAGNVSVTANQDVGGNLHVDGNLTVSGSQTIDGVTFANGGIVLSGTLGANNVSATNISGTYADIRNLSVTNGALVGTDVTVTRDVGVGRNLFVTNYAGVTRLGAGNVSVTANEDVGGDLRVGGNLYVSGSQSIDGVLFANGGIQMPGTVSASSVSVTNISGTYADIRNLSVTNGALVGTDVTVTRDVGVGRNLWVTGATNMTGLISAVNVSSTGGVSVTGNVSANRFIGNGSDLTGITAGNLGAAGVSGSVQFKGAVGEISGTNTLVWDNATSNLNVSGTVQMSGTGAETCGASSYGQMRFVNVGAGDFRMQFCRP